MTRLDDLQKFRCQTSLSYFIRHFWNTVDPSDYIHNWHIDAICEHLQAVSESKIRRLIINVPPRHQKSLSTCVFWPAWDWINRPARQWLYFSYAHALSIRDSIKCRRLIESDKYQKFFGDGFQLMGDQNTKIKFENDKNGCRICSSIGGVATGEGGDAIVIDDPHNIKDIESEIKRESVLLWWDSVLGTRLNHPKTGAIVIIMQRTHKRDLVGHVLENETGWEHLMLPERYESNHPFISHTSLGFVDKRNEGELLWPDRFGASEIAEINKRLGSYGVAGQKQQRPSPRGGGMIKLAWFKSSRYKALPVKFNRIIQSWDTAQKVKEINDYSVCTTWGELADGRIFLIDVFRKKLEYPELKRAVQMLFDKYKPAATLIEDKGSGTTLIQDLKYKVKAIAIEPKGNKAYRLDSVLRADAETPTLESGAVWLPESATWLLEFESELEAFPNAAHDDQIDSMTQYLNWKNRGVKYRKRKQKGF